MAADTVEVAQGSGSGEVLVADVGGADVGLGEGMVDEGFDYGGVDADSVRQSASGRRGREQGGRHGWPCSTTRPSLRTTIRSALRIVDNR